MNTPVRSLEIMDFTNPHGNEIGKLTEQFLIYLGFGSQQSKKIAYAARFHDIGTFFKSV